MLGCVGVGAQVHWVRLRDLNLHWVGTIDGVRPINMNGTINMDSIGPGHGNRNSLDDWDLYGDLNMLHNFVWHWNLLGNVNGDLALNMNWHWDLDRHLNGLSVYWHSNGNTDGPLDSHFSNLGITSESSSSRKTTGKSTGESSCKTSSREICTSKTSSSGESSSRETSIVTERSCAESRIVTESSRQKTGAMALSSREQTSTVTDSMVNRMPFAQARIVAREKSS